MSARTRVVHCQHEAYDVYIGRAMPKFGLAASKWANPFRIGRDGGRADVIKKYEAWVRTQPELMAALGEIRGKVLGCWCVPDPCHGDVLARLADGDVPLDTEGRLRTITQMLVHYGRKDGHDDGRIRDDVRATIKEALEAPEDREWYQEIVTRGEPDLALNRVGLYRLIFCNDGVNRGDQRVQESVFALVERELDQALSYPRGREPWIRTGGPE
jgi:hypothetical protein